MDHNQHYFLFSKPFWTLLVKIPLFSHVETVSIDYILVYLGQLFTIYNNTILMGKDSWTTHDWADHGKTNVRVD